MNNAKYIELNKNQIVPCSMIVRMENNGGSLTIHLLDRTELRISNWTYGSAEDIMNAFKNWLAS